MDLSSRISPCIFLSVFSALPLLNYPENRQPPFLLAHAVIVGGSYVCGKMIQSYQAVQMCASYSILVMDIAAFFLTSALIEPRDYVHPESLYIGILLVLLCGNTKALDNQVASRVLRWITFVYVMTYQLTMACGEGGGVTSAGTDLVTSSVICSLVTLAFSCDVGVLDEDRMGGAWAPVSLLVVSLLAPRIMWWRIFSDEEGQPHNFLAFRNAFQACDNESTWSHTLKLVLNMVAKLAFLHGCKRRLSNVLDPVKDREWRFFVAGGLTGLALYAISAPDEHAPTLMHTSNIVGSFIALAVTCGIYTTLCVGNI